MRALGLDLGSKRIGVAVSDPSGTIASPLTVLERARARRDDHQRIAGLVEDEGVGVLVVGLPISLSGDEGPAAIAARDEVAALTTVVRVPVETWDERLTTVTAQRVLREARVGHPERRKVVDMIAAAVMLQSWLDARSFQQ